MRQNFDFEIKRCGINRKLKNLHLLKSTKQNFIEKSLKCQSTVKKMLILGNVKLSAT